MDYIVTTLLYFFGVGFHVMQKIAVLRAKFPELPFSDVWNTFFKQDWDSLMVSGLGLCLVETALFISVYNKVPFPHWLDSWGMYLIASTLGYAAQRVFYKIFGTSEGILNNRIDQITK